MKTGINVIILTLLITFTVSGQEKLEYFLPDNIQYNPDIPTPASVIGHEVGEWHVSHDKLVRYMEVLAESSDRITLKETGRTYENRPLLVLTITSASNQTSIESLRQKHLALADPDQTVDNFEGIPMVVYMGYSIHGNEPSGSNSSLVVAYHLAAATGPEIDELLENTIILLDPSFNPDGLNRFANWVNSRKSQTPISDPNSQELDETWPGGRTNHYWFDLNRDWLPVQLPESRARLQTFHDWKPNILTDHHEMGTNSTFFFQPGIPSRNNPLTPAETYRLTEEMGKFHARALDNIGSLYFTKENYDDYYYGKGSTYPDINGAVGILFEQASSRGHAQESVNGILTFPFTIRNQFTTSLSTLEASYALREDFLRHQQTFFKDSKREAAASQEKVYLIGSRDKARIYHLGELISRHDIQVKHLNEGTTINGTRYSPDELLGIPLEQPQFRLIKAMFETRTSFQDSLFYDISTWTLPYAFGIDYRAGGSRDLNQLGDDFTRENTPVGTVEKIADDTYAYVIDPYGYYTHRAVYTLLDRGYTIRVANEPFNVADKAFPRGSIVVPVTSQPDQPEAISGIMSQLAEKNHLNIYTASTGLDYVGKSLGSPSFFVAEKPKMALLVGDGVRSYDAGEIWHLMDQRYEIPLTLLPVESVGGADLERYNVILMVRGRYSSLQESARDKLRRWVREGGTLIAFGDALSYLNGVGLGNFEFNSPNRSDSTNQRPYALLSETRGAQEIGGSIFRTRADLTHPLLYGYYNETVPLFKNDENFLTPASNPFANPLMFTYEPLMSGYISNTNAKAISNSSAIGVNALGSGRIIGFNSNVAFRAFWYGTNKLLLNAMFYGREISRGAAR